MVKLPVPYRSQWATDAVRFNGDCGPTCVAMVLNYRGVPISPDEIYTLFTYAADDKKRLTGYTDFFQLMTAIQAKGSVLNPVDYEDRETAFRNLRANLDAGNPFIALVKYEPWKTPLGNNFPGGHFVVVTGYDDDHIYMHDPLFGNWVKPPETGAHYAMTYDLFAEGWSRCHEDLNPDWAGLVNGTAVVAGAPPVTPPVTPPQPKPEPVPTPQPIPTPQPPAPGRTMDDVNRRIRALAAYRWAEPPNFANPEAVQLWQDHLGDFALAYDNYVVQSGDSLSALAARNYGSQHRWPVIKVFNDLSTDGVWVGQRIMIPRLGDSGAQNDPALPSDTADFSKDIDMLVDPDQEPLDYEALIGDTSMGLGLGG